MLVILSIGTANASEKKLSDAEYYNKVRGAWTGKCIGGALGMPIECWYYEEIAKKYPNINNYIGYFDEQWTGWSGIVKTVEIPRDREWHRLYVTVEVPAFDADQKITAPIVGMDMTYSKE
jgi:hypothetical protein